MSTQSILTAVNNSWPEFNPSSFSPNQTYVVTTTKTLTSNVILSENITLIFAGGKIASNASNTTRILKGNNTHIIAPISLIFEKEIQLDGSWIMDRAYPQWFGAKNNDEIQILQMPSIKRYNLKGLEKSSYPEVNIT